MSILPKDSGAEPEDMIELIDRFKYKREFTNLIRDRFAGSYVDRQFIYSAYDYQSGLFSGRNRESGGSYMNNHLVPTAILVTEILEIKDAEIVVAALGHDSIEDIKYVTFELFSKMFSPRSGYIVNGMTKTEASGRAKRSIEYSKEVVEKASSHGIDCMNLKCNADRLHNMLTLWGSLDKRKYKIWETEQYFLPEAKKFGLECPELRRAIRYQRKILQLEGNA
jgi:(p)ppGpp synthase/HD superfamily hydrolase